MLRRLQELLIRVSRRELLQIETGIILQGDPLGGHLLQHGELLLFLLVLALGSRVCTTLIPLVRRRVVLRFCLVK